MPAPVRIANVTPAGLAAGAHRWWIQTWNETRVWPLERRHELHCPRSHASGCSDPGLAQRKYHNHQSHLHLEQGLEPPPGITCMFSGPSGNQFHRLVFVSGRLWCHPVFACQCHDPGCWRAPLVDPDLEWYWGLWSLEHGHELHDGHAWCRNLDITQRRHDQQSDLHLEQGPAATWYYIYIQDLRATRCTPTGIRQRPSVVPAHVPFSVPHPA